MRVYLALAFLFLSIPGYGATVYFPQVVNGGGYQTTITISNPSEDAVTGTLTFYTPQGTPWSLSVNSVVNSQFDVSLQGSGSKRFTTSGTGNIAVGWAVVESTDTLSGVATYEVRSGTTLTESVGVLGATSITRFKVPADYDSHANVGVALVNVGNTPLNVNLYLANEQGIVTHTSADPQYQNIPAHGYVTKYVNQAFSSIPSTYQGALIGEVDGEGAMAVVSLILKDGVQSAVPVNDFTQAFFKNISGWFYFHYIWNSSDEYEDIYLGFPGAPTGYAHVPGAIWGASEYPDPLYAYFDQTRNRYVIVYPEPWDDANEVFMFYFTDPNNVEGCHYYQSPPDEPLTDCHPLYGEYAPEG